MHVTFRTRKDIANEFQKPGVYRIPCERGLVCTLVRLAGISHYVSKNIKTDCEKAELEKSAVAIKHCWTDDHCIKWNKVISSAAK